jgi:methionine biosynthesis protein MetW
MNVRPKDPPPVPAAHALRPDLRLVAEMVPPGTRVLDVGCGDGELLAFLSTMKGVDARGIELSQAGVNACVARGLSVIQGDADKDLADYPTGAFDFVILSRTIQETLAPKRVLENLLRIGTRVIVSFPNFGHWQVRLGLLFSGRMPNTRVLDQHWYETPNLHFCTIRDFVALTEALGAEVERAVALDRHGHIHDVSGRAAFANLFGVLGVFLLSRRGVRR